MPTTIGLDGLSAAQLMPEQTSQVQLNFADPYGRSRIGTVAIVPSASKATAAIMATRVL